MLSGLITNAATRCDPGDLAAVGGHGEGVGDDEDADEPGKGDPDVGAEPSPRKTCPETGDPT